MSDALTRHLTHEPSGREKADPRQVQNSSGAYVFEVGKLERLRRFLILGTEGGSYYASEHDITAENVDTILDLVKSDRWPQVLETTADISHRGLSYRNSAAIFVLAMVMTYGSNEAKAKAREYVTKIVRIGTHQALFAKYLKFMANKNGSTGLGSSRNKALAAWYQSKTTDELAYQAVKYRQREGWTHRDLFRQCRPKGINSELGKFILDKPVDTSELPVVVRGFLELQESQNAAQAVEVLGRYTMMPWEALPTNLHKEADVWKKIFYNGQLRGQALLRNITRLARLQAFDDMVFALHYAEKLSDATMIAKNRVHPIAYLNALIVHTEGQIVRDSRFSGYSSWYGYPTRRHKNWETSQIIVDALNAGFRASFGSIVPANKRTMVAVDVSSSMTWSAMGLDLSCAQVAGAMGLAIARTEPYYQIMGFAHEFRDLGIAASSSLQDALRRVQQRNFGSTDCALPMVYARKRKLEIDTFVVITDNETNVNTEHPHLALRKYRQETGIPARLVVAGVASNGFSIADPSDVGMLDTVGASSDLPKVIADFSRGDI